MEQIKLYSDLSRNITFKGELLKSSREETGTGTHTYMAIYKTSGGNFGCYKIYQTKWVNCSDQYLATICKTESEVIEFFGLGNQAKELYSCVDINCDITEDDYLKHGNPKQQYQDLNEFDYI